MSDSAKSSLFHEPELGKFDKQVYLSDVFEFMNGSLSLFDSSSKAISFQDELITLQPKLAHESLSEIFDHQLMSSICIDPSPQSIFKRLDFLIFANQSKPIGYLSIGLFETTIKIIDLKMNADLKVSQYSSDTFKVLLAWLFETTNLDSIDVKFEEKYGAMAAQMLPNSYLDTRNISD